MNELERFERLTERARREPIPPIDVTAQVMRDVGRSVQRPGPDVPMWIMSAASVAAAVAVMVIAFQTGAVFADPFAELFDPLTLVMR